MTRNKTFVYLQPFLHDLVRLEAKWSCKINYPLDKPRSPAVQGSLCVNNFVEVLNRQNRTSSNVAESLILDGLSDLAGVTGLNLEQVQEAASRLMTGQKVINGILFFRNGFLL